MFLSCCRFIFFCQHNSSSSETAQQNFVNFVDMTDIMFRCAYVQEILIQCVCPGSYAYFELLPNVNIQLNQFISETLTKNTIVYLVFGNLLFFYFVNRSSKVLCVVP